jgi:hypothetical protein
MAQKKAEIRLGAITKKGNSATPEEKAEAESIRNQWSAIKKKKLERDALKQRMELEKKKFELDERKQESLEEYRKDTLEAKERTLREKAGETKLAKESEIRQIIKESLGLSDMIQTTMDPTLRETAKNAFRLSSIIRGNPKRFGLPVNAGAGEIASLAVDLARALMAGETIPSHGRPPLESYR